MKHTIFLYLFLFVVVNIYAQLQKNEPEIFLNEAMLKSISFNANFNNSIDYTRGNLLLLSSYNQFYVLGVGGIAPIFEKTNNKIDAFSVATFDKILMVISGKSLLQIDSIGNFIKVMTLPDDKMGIASGNSRIYLFNQSIQNNKTDYSLFSLTTDLELKKIVSFKTPITAVYEYGSDLFFTTENKLYRANDVIKAYTEVVALPQEKNTIVSIVGDTINNAFYISTKDAIYRINQNNVLECISTDFGGILKYDGEGLLVFNPENSLIVRFRNNILYSSEIEPQK